MKCLVQVNGKVVYDDDGAVSYITAETTSLQEEGVVNIPAVIKAVGAREVKKIVVVPNRIINVIARLKKSYEY